jgi:two-component system phosphate regulon sensor histidine kinase PhoR
MLGGCSGGGSVLRERKLKVVSRFPHEPGHMGADTHTQSMRATFSMRWWLALTFAGIAALTALSVAQVFTARSSSALHARAQDLAAGAAVAAAAQISQETTNAGIRTRAAEVATARQLSLFVFGNDGSLITPTRSGKFSVEQLPNYGRLRASALRGRRVVETIDDGRLVTVALPLRGERAAALIVVASRPDLETALGIVKTEIVSAALWATGIGALVGLVVAALITWRLRRIAGAAAEIEEGRFDRELKPRFPDELGALAGTIDRMRERLRISFDRLEGERFRLHRLLEQLQEGVIAVDRTLRVEFANSRARLLLSPDLTPGQPLPDPWTAASLHDLVGSLFAKGARPQTIRIQPDPERTYLVGLLPPGPALDAAVVVVTDVTTRERRERAEREFVTNAAHELRTPLSAISSAVEVLQAGAKEDEADRDRFLAIVERQTTRLTRLVRALLTLAHAQTRSDGIRLEAVPVAPLVRELAAGLDNQSVTVDVCCEDVAVIAHEDLLRQALENLTANALKHAAGEGLTLEVAHISDDRVRLAVADRGPGMTKVDAAKAADRFFRPRDSDGKGFGLGLSIVREAVRVMNGTLSIESELGKGTRVSIELESTSNGRHCR